MEVANLTGFTVYRQMWWSTYFLQTYLKRLHGLLFCLWLRFILSDKLVDWLSLFTYIKMCLNLAISFPYILVLWWLHCVHTLKKTYAIPVLFFHTHLPKAKVIVALYTAVLLHWRIGPMTHGSVHISRIFQSAWRCWKRRLIVCFY
jgi:ABC-type methionine transport system permease subunit